MQVISQSLLLSSLFEDFLPFGRLEKLKMTLQPLKNTDFSVCNIVEHFKITDNRYKSLLFYMKQDYMSAININEQFGHFLLKFIFIYCIYLHINLKCL